MAKFYYGGQAVIEGVMMRGRKRMAVAVRAPNGEIVVHEEPLTAAIYTKKWGQWPFVRGLRMLWDALGLGMRALALVGRCVAEGRRPGERSSSPARWPGRRSRPRWCFLWRSSSCCPPRRPSGWRRWRGAGWLVSVVEGVIRLALFLLYLWAIGFMPDIRRVFAYHGAEHKTINAYEAGAPLTPGIGAAVSPPRTPAAAPASCCR